MGKHSDSCFSLSMFAVYKNTWQLLKDLWGFLALELRQLLSTDIVLYLSVISYTYTTYLNYFLYFSSHLSDGSDEKLDRTNKKQPKMSISSYIFCSGLSQ